MNTVSEHRRLANPKTETAEHIPPQALSARLSPLARAFASKPFVPHPFFPGPHAQTIISSKHPPRRRAFREEPAHYESRLFEVDPGSRVLLKCRWQPERRAAPTLLLLHGLEGSSAAHYMGGMADKAFTAGWNVVRLKIGRASCRERV